MLANEYIFLIYTSVISVSIFGSLLFGVAGLTALMSLFAVLINLFVTKHITLFGITATAADPLAIGIPLTLNMLQEYCGQQPSKQAIWISFYIAFVYVTISMLHIWYTPSSVDASHQHFYALLIAMPRIVGASFATFLVTQFSDWYLYRTFRKWTSRRFALIANYSSTAISQAIDTLLFSFLGLYGIMHNLGEIILVSYTIKMITLACTAPFIVMTRNLYYHLPQHWKVHKG